MIFDISLAKTGTTSLCNAMRLLGYRTTHGVPSKYKADTLRRLQRGNVEMPWFAEYDFVGNVFGFAFQDLHRAYPAAQFIYLERPISAIVASTQRQLARHKPKLNNVQIQLDVFLRICNIKSVYAVSDERLFDLFVNNRLEVQQYFRGNSQFLRMSIKHGWEPLCKFLGRPIPDLPFPHDNKSR